MSETFRFAPGIASDLSGIPFTPAPVTIDTPAAPKAPKQEAEKPFRFAEGLTTKTAPVVEADTFAHAGLGGFEKDHHDHDDCDCGGDCSDCAKKAAALYHAPGTRLRHKLTNKIYTKWSRRNASVRTIARARCGGLTELSFWRNIVPARSKLHDEFL